MKNFTPLQSFFLALPLFLAFALPAQAGKVSDCAPKTENGIYVKRFTNYAPKAGGINGRCGTSASGKDACKFFLEDHLEGKRAMTMGAVTQKGGTSKLFGGKYRAVALEQKLGAKQIVLYAGDRYGKGSNYQCKMDIVTRKIASTTTSKVNTAKGLIAPLGRIENLPPPKREIKREPAAEEPLVTNPGRCRTVKRCKIRGQLANGSACAPLGWHSQYICFEKEKSCNPNPGSCTDAFR